MLAGKICSVRAQEMEEIDPHRHIIPGFVVNFMAVRRENENEYRRLYIHARAAALRYNAPACDNYSLIATDIAGS
jgi:hypothetical protein